mgnify:CR=1 FL=1
MAGLVPKAVEHAVCTQGDENQPDAVLCQLCRAAFAVGGAGEQGQLFIGHFQDIHQRQGSLHLGNGILFVLPVAEKQPNGEILLDKNSIEVFANDGEQTMTAWIYTPQSADGITFAADGKATVTAEQFELNL